MPAERKSPLYSARLSKQYHTIFNRLRDAAMVKLVVLMVMMASRVSAVKWGLAHEALDANSGSVPSVRI